MEFKAENFTDAINEFKNEFSLTSYDVKKDPHSIIAFYQAISVRKIELTMQDMLKEIQTLNSKLDGIKDQMGRNTSSIVDAIDKLPQAHDPL